MEQEDVQVFLRMALTGDLVTHITLPVSQTVAELGRLLKEKAAFPIWTNFILDGSVLERSSTLAAAGIHDQTTLLVEVPQAIVTTSEDCTAKIWNVDRCECEMTLEGHTAPVYAAVFSPDARLVATCSEDHTARIWSMASGNSVRTYKHSAAVQAAAFSPDCRWAVTASEDGIAQVWLMKFGSCRHVLEGHKGSIISAGFTEDGTSIVTSSSTDGTSRIWGLKTGAIERILICVGNLYSVTWVPGGRSYVTTGSSGPLFVAQICNAETGECERTLKGHTNLVLSVAFAPERAELVAARSQIFPLQT